MRTKNLILIIIAVVVVVILAGLIVYNYAQDSDDVVNNTTEEENNQTSENNTTNESNTTSSNSSQGSTGSSSSSSSSDSDSNVTYGTDPRTGVKTKTVNGETYGYSDEYQDYLSENKSGDVNHVYNPDRTIDEYTNEKTGHMWGYYDGKHYDEYW